MKRIVLSLIWSSVTIIVVGAWLIRNILVSDVSNPQIWIIALLLMVLHSMSWGMALGVVLTLREVKKYIDNLRN